MLRFLTAGESHGKALMGIIEGFPSNVKLDIDEINNDLRRRQEGYGRGGRMKIEKDKVSFLSGIRDSYTLGSPIGFIIENKDFENWKEEMDPLSVKKHNKITRPRPGHSDLVGAIKYDFDDIRNVLERSSARETTTRVVIGSIINQLLKLFDIRASSHVVEIGKVKIKDNYTFDDIKRSANSSVKCIFSDTEEKMIKEIDNAKLNGDSLGGTVEVQIKGVPSGLGSYVNFDRKIDAKLSSYLMSIQGVKSVEIGRGRNSASILGSKYQDEIYYNEEVGYFRKTNNSGGIEGGMTNGETIIIRCSMKPIPTLYKPLSSVNIKTKEPETATIERSDNCAVPSLSVIAELVALTVIGEEFLRVYGSDSLNGVKLNWKNLVSN